MGRTRKHEIHDTFGIKGLYDLEEVDKHYCIFIAMCNRKKREARELPVEITRPQKIITLPKKKHKIEKSLKHILCNNGAACTHSTDCWYAHSEEEMTIVKCTFGVRCENVNCRYTHPEGHNIKPKAVCIKPCFFIQPDGTCKFGAECKYSHEPPLESLIITFDSSFDEVEEEEEEFDEDKMSNQLQELYIT